MQETVSDIQAKLKSILMEASTDLVSGEAISETTALAGKGAALDSVALLEVVLRIEKEFGVILDDDSLRLEHFQTLNALAQLVHSKRYPKA